jgi:hypothetical protein
VPLRMRDRAGTEKIVNQIVPVVQDCTSSIFPGKRMAATNANRYVLPAGIEKVVSRPAGEFFGLIGDADPAIEAASSFIPNRCVR